MVRSRHKLQRHKPARQGSMRGWLGTTQHAATATSAVGGPPSPSVTTVVQPPPPPREVIDLCGDVILEFAVIDEETRPATPPASLSTQRQGQWHKAPWRTKRKQGPATEPPLKRVRLDEDGGYSLGGDFRGGDALGGDFRDDALSGYALGGDVRGGNALSGDALGGDVRGGNAVSGDALGGDVRGGNAVSGDALGGDVRGGNALSGDDLGDDSQDGDYPSDSRGNVESRTAPLGIAGAGKLRGSSGSSTGNNHVLVVSKRTKNRARRAKAKARTTSKIPADKPYPQLLRYWNVEANGEMKDFLRGQYKN